MTPPRGPAKPKPASKIGTEVLRALRRTWGDINGPVQEALIKIGFKPPEPEPEDPLQQALEAYKSQLPKEVLEAYQAANKIPEPSQREQGATATKSLSQATWRYKALAKKQIEAQVRIDHLKEQLRVELEAIQQLTDQIKQAQAEVEDAKTKVAAIVLGQEAPGKLNSDSEEMQVETSPDSSSYQTILQKLGVTLTEDQKAQLDQLVVEARKDLTHKRQKTEVETPPGLGTGERNPDNRGRSRTPPGK